MDFGRVAAVSAKGTTGWTFGSGYRVSRHLVLTAGHVVAASAGVIVRIGTDRYAGRVVYRGLERRRGPLDAALVEIGDAPGDGPAAVRWGRLVCASPGVICTATGFPLTQLRENGADRRAPDGVDQDIRDSEQLSGCINPGTGLYEGLYHIDVGSGPSKELINGQSPWAGISGAAVLAAGLVIAVIIEEHPHFGRGRLIGLPVAALVTDDVFAGLISDDTGRAVALESAELEGIVSRGEHNDVRSPGFLLRAEAETVRFRGRSGDFDRLEDAGRGARVAVSLVTGPGGQGKTRLGRQWATSWGAAGWVTGLVDDIVDVSTLRPIADVRDDLLLVVDYAETRPDVVHEIIRLMQARASSRASRLLLLARAAGDWWDRLRVQSAATASVLAAVEPTDLGPLETTTRGREDAFREALTDLAEGLRRVDGLVDEDWPRVAAGMPVPDVSPAVYERVLTLHMVALACLLQAGNDPVAAPHHVPVESILLLHEQRYWDRTARANGLSASPAALRVAVAAAVLWGARTEDAAVATLGGLPGWAGQSKDRLLKAASWIRSLGPTESGAYWGQPLPDPLGEHLVAKAFEESPRLLVDFAAHPYEEMKRALTALERACVGHADVRRELARLVASDGRITLVAIVVAAYAKKPGHLLGAITRVAKRLSPNIRSVIEAIVNLSAAGQMDDPVRRRALADVDAAVRRLVAESVEPDAIAALAAEPPARRLFTAGESLAVSRQIVVRYALDRRIEKTSLESLADPRPGHPLELSRVGPRLVELLVRHSDAATHDGDRRVTGRLLCRWLVVWGERLRLDSRTAEAAEFLQLALTLATDLGDDALATIVGEAIARTKTPPPGGGRRAGLMGNNA